jgi:DEAD/DEAH box helicase domain-containing protein
MNLVLGVDSPACKDGNDVSSKTGAQVILRGVLGLAIDLRAIPDVDPDSIPETVVEAEAVWGAEGVRVEVYESK